MWGMKSPLRLSTWGNLWRIGVVFGHWGFLVVIPIGQRKVVITPYFTNRHFILHGCLQYVMPGYNDSLGLHYLLSGLWNLGIIATPAVWIQPLFVPRKPQDCFSSCSISCYESNRRALTPWKKRATIPRGRLQMNLVFVWAFLLNFK